MIFSRKRVSNKTTKTMLKFILCKKADVLMRCCCEYVFCVLYNFC